MNAIATPTMQRGMPAAEMMHERVLVLGVGNLLVGDEGVGLRVAQRLQQRSWPEHVEIVDAGKGGFQLLDLLQTAPRVILIDAARDGLWPGSVNHFHAVDPLDFPPALGAHDIGLKALLTAASLLGDLPRIEVITISVDDFEPMTADLSPEVAAALPVVERLVQQLVR